MKKYWIGGCKTVPEGDLGRLRRQRDELLSASLAGGARFYSGNKSKIYSGRLSPGCETCAGGRWSCLVFHQLCTRKCFFCPRDRETVIPPLERHMRMIVARPEDYPALLKKAGFTGVGISGGEPLMEFPRLIRYLRHARRALGSAGYLWVYTNGDLVDEDKLRALSAAGLDELRFDLSARGYDLAPLKPAIALIKTVAVEIPAIPEDVAVVKGLLPRLADMGVKHLNLHQLTYTPHNYGQLSRRGYTAAQRGLKESFGAVESELAALELLRWSVERGLTLSVNYCSCAYKTRFQPRIARARAAQYSSGAAGRRKPAGLTTITGSGMERQLSIKAPIDLLRPLRGGLSGTGSTRLVQVDGESALQIAPSLIDSPLLDPFVIDARYHEYVREEGRYGGASWPSVQGRRRGCEYQRRERGAIALSSRASRSLFKRLFHEGQSVDEAGLALGGAAELAPEIASFHRRFEGLEYLPAGLPTYLDP